MVVLSILALFLYGSLEKSIAQSERSRPFGGGQRRHLNNNSPASRLYLEMFPPNWQEECSDQCCQHKRHVSYLSASQELIKSRKGKTLGELKEELQKAIWEATLSEELYLMGQDYTHSLRLLKQLPVNQAPRDEIAPILDNMLVIDTIIDEIIRNPQSSLLNTIGDSELENANILSELTDYFQCEGRAVALCQFIAKGDPRLAIKVRILIDGHRATKGDTSPHEIANSFKKYKKRLNRSLPKSLKQSLKKRNLHQSFGNSFDILNIPSQFNRGLSKSCKAAYATIQRNNLQSPSSDRIIEINCKRNSSDGKIRDLRKKVTKIESDIGEVTSSQNHVNLERSKHSFLRRIENDCRERISHLPPEENCTSSRGVTILDTTSLVQYVSDITQAIMDRSVNNNLETQVRPPPATPPTWVRPLRPLETLPIDP